jgi:hypothetical protein
MFKKLFTGADIDFKVHDMRIEFDLNAQGKKIQYFNVSSTYADDLIASFGPYSKHFHTSFVVIGADVPPHTDIVDSVNINFYVNTSGYKTTFYRSNSDSTKLTYADHGDGHVYNPSELEELDSFIASPGDVYILNGKVIHGVSAPNHSSTPRQILQVSSNDLEYKQVLDLMRNIC